MLNETKMIRKLGLNKLNNSLAVCWSKRIVINVNVLPPDLKNYFPLYWWCFFKDPAKRCHLAANKPTNHHIKATVSRKKKKEEMVLGVTSINKSFNALP